MPAARELKRRIKSIKNTKKITRAMQMVSAAKMRKAQNAALASRTYTRLADEIADTLLPYAQVRYNPLLRSNPKAGKVGIVVISSNRGLVGGFNSNLLKAALEYESGQPHEVISEFTVSGRKARESLYRLHKHVVADYPKQEGRIEVAEILPLASSVMREYIGGKYSSVVVVYMEFISTLVQKPKVMPLLPFQGVSGAVQAEGAEEDSDYEPFLLEPSQDTVLDSLLPRIIEARIYQAILESDAAEHSARMVMMKSATEAASDLIDDLTLTYNQLRQAGITKELAEITAGRAAIE